MAPVTVPPARRAATRASITAGHSSFSCRARRFSTDRRIIHGTATAVMPATRPSPGIPLMKPRATLMRAATRRVSDVLRTFAPVKRRRSAGRAGVVVLFRRSSTTASMSQTPPPSSRPHTMLGSAVTTWLDPARERGQIRSARTWRAAREPSPWARAHRSR